jgi:hypothetical protein
MCCIFSQSHICGHSGPDHREECANARAGRPCVNTNKTVHSAQACWQCVKPLNEYMISRLGGVAGGSASLSAAPPGRYEAYQSPPRTSTIGAQNSLSDIQAYAPKQQRQVRAAPTTGFEAYNEHLAAVNPANNANFGSGLTQQRSQFPNKNVATRTNVHAMDPFLTQQPFQALPMRPPQQQPAIMARRQQHQQQNSLLFDTNMHQAPLFFGGQSISNGMLQAPPAPASLLPMQSGSINGNGMCGAFTTQAPPASLMPGGPMMANLAFSMGPPYPDSGLQGSSNNYGSGGGGGGGFLGNDIDFYTRPF